MKFRETETLIRESGATHRKNNEGVGGRLFLTNQRLIFKSHFFNIQVHEEVIPLEDIASIEAKHSDFISVKMSLNLKSGSTHTFLVHHRSEWIEEIVKAAEALMGDKIFVKR